MCGTRVGHVRNVLKIWVENYGYIIILDYKFLSVFAVALRPNAGHGLLILEVSRSHTTTYHSR
jgi:hypothetical protein